MAGIAVLSGVNTIRATTAKQLQPTWSVLRSFRERRVSALMSRFWISRFCSAAGARSLDCLHGLFASTGFGQTRHPAALPQRFAGRHGGGDRDIERAQAGPYRDHEAGIGGVVDALRPARRFAAEQQLIVRREAVGE